MTTQAYLVGGPAAGKVVAIHDEQEEIEVRFVKPDGSPDLKFRTGRYAPKVPADLEAHEFYWMGEI